ncbi:hypothetical protein EI77_01587 [Prosthecobacter fusiformis]|uniref:Thymidylate kinase n=1 Tax=Prosthecobacter fusiformis TaxID=48464 RepID=A0A4R7S5F9_9BACT|nr:AAA family ATPase [Prosthecobacter fusiformis]TDU73119.1 hypothetical protein EI77_01587 [Prosthecobacter fusiformis]
MIVVELAGDSGVGKSTMSAIVAERLRQVLGDEAVAALPEKNVPRRSRRWTRVKRWVWVTTHPAALLTAWKTTESSICTASYYGWMRCLSTVGLARKAVKQGVQVALVDQGILRLQVLPQHIHLLPRTSLPDLVLHLVADPAILEKRRISRSKKKCVRHQGEARISAAITSLHTLGAEMDEAKRRVLLDDFGHKFCDQPFSEEEITHMLAMPSTPVTAESKPEGLKAGRCHPQVCQLLQAQGIRLEKLDTSLHDLETTAENCCRAILSVLGFKGKLEV